MQQLFSTLHARGGKVIFTTCAYPDPKGLNKATPWKEHSCVYLEAPTDAMLHNQTATPYSTETAPAVQHREKK